MPQHSKPMSPTARMTLRGVTLAALLWLVAGCSSQFLYNRLDALAYVYVKTQVSLEDLQSQQLRNSLRAFHDWHRGSELPRYASFAQGLARDAARPLGRARIDAARLELEALWRDAVARGADDAARFLAGLSPAQRSEFFTSLGADDAELREEYCETPLAKRQRRQFEDVVELAEDWVGSLTAAQREQLRLRLAALQPTGCRWVESRIRVRTAFRELAERGTADPDYYEKMRRLMQNPEERWDPAYRAAFAANRDAFIDMLAELDASLTTRQRAQLSAKFAGYARDFRSWAGAGPG